MVPSEYDEQVAFVKYCMSKGFPVFHVPNSTYTKSFKQKAKNKALGVSSGVPDLFVVIPSRSSAMVTRKDVRCPKCDVEICVFARRDLDHYRLVAIEMKRTKGGTTSPQQAQWLSTLASAGIEGAVCKGCDAAIKWVEERI